jgi:hypothetical protein
MEKGQPSRKKRRVEPGSEAGGEDDALDQPKKAHQQEKKEEKPQKRKDMPEEKRPSKKARKNGDIKRYISCKKWKEEEEKARREKDLEGSDLIKISKEIVRELETSRWSTNKPGIEEALGKVMGWTDEQTDLRIHLLGWLATKTDEQIQQEAVETVSALETVAHTRNMTQMGEDIMTDVVRLCTIVISREEGIMTTNNKDEEGTGQATEQQGDEQDIIIFTREDHDQEREPEGSESGTRTGGGGKVPPVGGLIQEEAKGQ